MKNTQTPKLVAINAAELAALPRPRPTHGQRWGKWVFDAHNLTLTLEDGYDYEIDLERCRTGAELLDFIIQVSDKTWCTREDAGYLLTALRELLDPQANLCSFGQNKSMNVASYLRKQ